MSLVHLAGICERMHGLVLPDPLQGGHIVLERGEVPGADDFFGAEKFPTATFKGSDFKFDGDKLVSVGGNLTLKGVTKPVTLAVSAFNCGNHPMNKKAMCGADASVTIKRTDFGINYGVPALGDDVKLSIPVEAFKD